MSNLEVQSAGQAVTGLSQWQRVANTFSAPSKTFEDIKRGNKSWWMPLIVLALFGYIFFAAVNQKIGMQQVVDNQIRMNPKAQEQMEQAPPEQREKGNKFWLGFTEAIFVGGPILGMATFAVLSAVLLGTINFGFGGRATYGSIFAVYYYAWLPQLIKALLGTVVVYAGMAPESFNIKNFAPTNLGAFLDPVETNKALYTFATSLDFVTIWTLVLLSIGLATVAGVKRSSGYITVFGWWALVVLLSTVGAAFAG
jgi:hypothetical protein